MWKMGVFQNMHTSSKRVWSVIGFNGTTCLKDYLATIHHIGNLMNSDTTLLLASLKHSAMDIGTIHADSAELGQERRVDINHATFVGTDERFRNNSKETSQYD